MRFQLGMVHHFAQKAHEAATYYSGGVYTTEMLSAEEYLEISQREVDARALGDNPGATELILSDDFTDDDRKALLLVERTSLIGQFQCSCLAGPSDHRAGCTIIEALVKNQKRCAEDG